MFSLQKRIYFNSKGQLHNGNKNLKWNGKLKFISNLRVPLKIHFLLEILTMTLCKTESSILKEMLMLPAIGQNCVSYYLLW